LNYISKLQPKKSKTKKVKFQIPPNSAPVESVEPEPVESVPSKSKRSKITSKSKANSKAKTAKVTNATKSTKPKSLTKKQKTQIMMEFVNNFGERIRHITKGELKKLARKEGIKLDTESDKEMLKEIAIEFAESYETMNLKVALFIMGLNPDYSLEELLAKFKEKSAQILPDKPVSEKMFAPEIKRLNKVFDFLKERLGNSFEYKSIDMPSDTSIINMSAVGLYNPETVFLFYSKSSDKEPGKGAGEKINPEDVNQYVPLSKIKNWRKMLSNFWAEPFYLDGKTWQSVEHYYQASKFKGTPEFYNQFSLDSGSDISKDPKLAKTAGGKTGKQKSIFIRPKDIKMDEGFYPNRSKIEMYKAQHAKFTQNEKLMKVLKLTGDAKLVHHVRGSPPIVFDNLMYIRSKL
jgi:hypothetical protein